MRRRFTSALAPALVVAAVAGATCPEYAPATRQVFGQDDLPSYCAECGRRFEADAKFCAGCGKPRTGSAPAPAAPARRSAEPDALETLRRIAVAQSIFRDRSKDEDSHSFGTLRELVDAELLSSSLASAEKKDGYAFAAGPGTSARDYLWWATATPASPESGDRHFVVNHLGVIFSSPKPIKIDTATCELPSGLTAVEEREIRPRYAEAYALLCEGEALKRKGSLDAARERAKRAYAILLDLVTGQTLVHPIVEKDKKRARELLAELDSSK